MLLLFNIVYTQCNNLIIRKNIRCENKKDPGIPFGAGVLHEGLGTRVHIYVIYYISVTKNTKKILPKHVNKIPFTFIAQY